MVLYPSIMVKLLPYREIPNLTSRALVPDDQFNILSFFFSLKNKQLEGKLGVRRAKESELNTENEALSTKVL